MSSNKFRNKLVVIEAFQMTQERRRDNRDWPNWLHEAWQKDFPEQGAVRPVDWPNSDGTDQVMISGPGGTQPVVRWNDWIIHTKDGDLCMCNPDIFAKAYEPIETDRLSASEAVCGFAAWLTTRDVRTVMSSGDHASPIAELVDDFCRENDLEKPRDDWATRLRHPK